MATICVDFDMVLHDAMHPPSASARMGPPMEGAKEAIIKLREDGHHIMIHSCKKKRAIEGWMIYFGIPYDSIWEEKGKPIASVYIDDRALRFKSWEQVMSDLKDLLPSGDVPDVEGGLESP